MNEKIVVSNIHTDKPNTNGRIYPREVLEQMANDINTKQIMLLSQPPEGGIVNLLDAIGILQNATINENNQLEVEIKEIDLYPNKFAKIMGYDIVPNGIGELDEKRNVKNYNLISMSAVQKNSNYSVNLMGTKYVQ